MKLYNSHTDKIEDLKVIIHSTGTFYVEKISEAKRNSLGYYDVVEDINPSTRYVESVINKELLNNKYVISYTANNKNLADVQALMIKDLEETANIKFNEATAGYTAGEMAGWRELENEANSHNNPDPLTSGMLYEEAMISDITVDELVAKVLFNATQFKQVKSYISGTRKFKSTEIMSLIDVDACIAYENFVYGYTITAEDVANDIDGTLVEGTVVPRTGNKVKDWTI